MNILFLSILQSITEFLPVSSSGHLIVFPALLGLAKQGIAIDIGLHIGTLLAVCLYFLSDLWRFFTGLWRGGDARRTVFLLVVATLPILIIGFFCNHYVEDVRYPKVICATLILFGVLLWVSDKTSKSDKTLDDLSFLNAFIIGFFQCLALIPGVSRSGITMTAARFCRLNRSEAAKFSMLLSIPVISAAGAWLLFSLFQSGQTEVLDKTFWESILYSFLGGIFVIRFLMRFVKKHSFLGFMVYRICLGIFVFFYLYSFK